MTNDRTFTYNNDQYGQLCDFYIKSCYTWGKLKKKNKTKKMSERYDNGQYDQWIGLNEFWIGLWTMTNDRTFT